MQLAGGVHMARRVKSPPAGRKNRTSEPPAQAAAPRKPVRKPARAAQTPKRKVSKKADKPDGSWVGIKDAVSWYRKRYGAAYRTARNRLYGGFREDAEQGFPAKKDGKGDVRFNLSELGAWFDEQRKAAHNRKTGGLLQTSLSSGEAAGSEQQTAVSKGEVTFIDVLADPFATPVDKARATYNLSTLRLSQMARQGAVSGNMLGDISKTLQELRRAEEGYMQIEERRGLLIPLDLCQEVVGELVRRLNDVCNRLVALLSTEIEVWMAEDVKSNERKRKIRAWLFAQMHEIKTLEGKQGTEILGTLINRVEQRREEMKGKRTHGKD